MTISPQGNGLKTDLYAMFVYLWKFIVAHINGEHLFIYFFICLTDNTLWESRYAGKRVNIIHAGNEHKVKKDRVTKILYGNVDFAWRHMEYRIIAETAERSVKIELDSRCRANQHDRLIF